MLRLSTPNEYKAWRQQPDDFKMRAGRMPTAHQTDFYPVRDIWERATAVLANHCSATHAGQTVLLVAHSAINRALIGSAIGLAPESLNSMGQDNCAINVLNFLGMDGRRARS